MVAKEYKNSNKDKNTVPEHIKQTSEVISLYDVMNKKLLYISPAFQDYWGLTIEETLKNPSIIRKKLYPEDADRLFSMFRSPSSSPSEIEYRVKGEQDNWFRTTIVPIVDTLGNVIKIINFTRDITYWKKRDQQLLKVKQIDQLGQIAAAFAHEIRNPLTTIKGFLQLLDQDRANPYQQIILHETEKIESIINEFLMLAQPYPKFDFTLVDLKEIMNDIFLTINPEAMQKKIEVFITWENSIPPVIGSSAQIKQALLNLIKNAFQATPLGGRIFISVSIPAEEGISIRIKDEGKGISPDKLNRLGIPSYSNKEEGAGLGIMISRQIINNHQGDIQFSSVIGKGTTVEVRLPSANAVGYYGRF